MIRSQREHHIFSFSLCCRKSNPLKDQIPANLVNAHTHFKLINAEVKSVWGNLLFFSGTMQTLQPLEPCC